MQLSFRKAILELVRSFLKLPDMSDDALNLGVEKLFVSLIEFRNSDAFFLADVKLLLQSLVFCHWDCGVERSRFAVW